MVRTLIAAVLLAGTTSLYAQPSTPPTDADKAARREQIREKAKAARDEARKACEGKQGDEHRDCMTHQVCSKAKDPDQCESRTKERLEKRKARIEQRKSQGPSQPPQDKK